MRTVNPGDAVAVRTLLTSTPGRLEKAAVAPGDVEPALGELVKTVPPHPFFGSMGVAPPPAMGRPDSAPPWMHAGNLDNKELVAGTVLSILMIPKAIFAGERK